MTTARINIPEKLIPIFEGKADVRGSHGGRGSAKTRTFALMSAVMAYKWDMEGKRGIILVARQHLNSLDDSSMEEIKQAIESTNWLVGHFDIGEKYIRTKSGNIQYKFAGLDRNITSIKSKSHIQLCWIDEAEPVTESAWMTLIPTIREEDSELWVTWNPERDGSPVDKRFRKTTDPLYKIAEMNWRDNPKFPDKLVREKTRDEANRPEQVDHIWEGGYKTVIEGTYFVKQLHAAKEENRIGVVAPDELITFKAFADIGGTGRRSDNFVFWIAQFVGRQVLAVNHYESQGQPIAAHLAWLRENGYLPANTTVWLPHDGDTNDKVFDINYQSAFQKAGYDSEIVPNQGAGAALNRVEVARRVFPNVSFDKKKTDAGLKALAWYHEKLDEVRGIGLGPDHDWSSHSADAYGMMCMVYEQSQEDVGDIGDPYSGFR
ncbi:MAG: PBSX family phage terminase large subunit [Planctomycetes bacterium]|nr:PBSX family phage terminase large subunit [Planctomycetota bacterium]